MLLRCLPIIYSVGVSCVCRTLRASALIQWLQSPQVLVENLRSANAATEFYYRCDCYLYLCISASNSLVGDRCGAALMPFAFLVQGGQDTVHIPPGAAVWVTGRPCHIPRQLSQLGAFGEHLPRSSPDAQSALASLHGRVHCRQQDLLTPTEQPCFPDINAAVHVSSVRTDLLARCGWKSSFAGFDRSRLVLGSQRCELPDEELYDFDIHNPRYALECYAGDELTEPGFYNATLTVEGRCAAHPCCCCGFPFVHANTTSPLLTLSAVSPTC